MDNYDKAVKQENLDFNNAITAKLKFRHCEYRSFDARGTDAHAPGKADGLKNNLIDQLEAIGCAL